MLTGFSTHICDVVQKQRRWQKPIVTILVGERANDAFKSHFCDRAHLGQFWNDHIFVIVCAKGLITLFTVQFLKRNDAYRCVKQIATHNLQLKFVLLAYDITVFVLIL